MMSFEIPFLTARQSFCVWQQEDKKQYAKKLSPMGRTHRGQCWCHKKFLFGDYSFTTSPDFHASVVPNAMAVEMVPS